MDAHSSEAASADIDRRRLLKAGAVGAAATGALVAGGPKVLGLGTAPVYAAGQSDAGGTTTTLDPLLGSVMVTLHMKDGLTLDASFPDAVPPQNVYMYGAADRSGTPTATTTASAPKSATQFSYTFTGVTPGTHYVDIQEPFQSYADQWLVDHNLDAIYQFFWNFSDPVDEPWLPVLDEFQEVTVTAGNTTPLELDIQVRLITL